jgi:hypothetical protein
MLNWKGCGMTLSWPNLTYYAVICLKGLRKNTENLSRDIRSSGRYLYPEPPEREAGVLSTRP